MLVFVIPVKCKKISKSWSLLSKLFERTLRSVCNQTSSNFRVVVVCNEKPNVHFQHPYVEYVEVDFPPPISDSKQAGLDNYGYDGGKVVFDQDADKAKKILAGFRYALKFNPSHFMAVDADDCVSRYLAEFIDQNQQAECWVFKRGYLYSEKSPFLFLNVKNFNETCGTSVIIKSNLYHPLFPGGNHYSHHFDPVTISDFTAKPLPFVGAVYSMMNGENIFMDSKRSSVIIRNGFFSRFFSKNILAITSKIMKYRFLIMTQSIRDDFGMYDLSA